jgi:alpha-tubulin suppressor-like RCC1 family protein
LKPGESVKENLSGLIKELSAKRIFNCDCIKFIAAGEHHSLAISRLEAVKSANTKELALYSWGWSAHGQLGHAKVGNNYN